MKQEEFKEEVASTKPQDSRADIPQNVSADQPSTDYLAIGVFVAVLCLFVAAGLYLTTHGSRFSFPNPLRLLSTWRKGPEPFEICKSYLLQDKKVPRFLGANLRFDLLHETEYRVDGRRQAEIDIRVTGGRGTRDFHFQLVADRGKWRLERAVMKRSRRVPARRSHAKVEKPAQRQRLSSSAGPTSKADRVPTSNQELAEFARRFPDIEELRITLRTEITDVSPLVGLGKLKRLHLQGCLHLQDLSPLARITSLEDLVLPPKTTDEQFGKIIPRLLHLKSLSLHRCSQVTDLSALAGLEDLSELSLEGLFWLKDLTPLTELPSLAGLKMSYTHIRDISPLAHLSGLISLTIEGNGKLRDISPLSRLTKLTFLTLSACSYVRDVSALTTLTNLRRLNLRHSRGVTPDQIAALKEALPDCTITQ